MKQPPAAPQPGPRAHIVLISSLLVLSLPLAGRSGQGLLPPLAGRAREGRIRFLPPPCGEGWGGGTNLLVWRIEPAGESAVLVTLGDTIEERVLGQVLALE